jgi:catechol 2,3-dioxygenase-like lactoylglutathione lyase family enzyme
MAKGTRIGSAVMFVQQLDRSISFYRDVLALRVADQSPTAALLVSPEGSELILRSMGSTGAHPLGAVGVQYVIWTAADRDDLDRCERVLKERSAYRETRGSDGIVLVEGHDPDDTVVMIAYPGPDQRPLQQLPTRIYGW